MCAEAEDVSLNSFDFEKTRALLRRYKVATEKLSVLSPREREVLWLVAEGLSTKAIAEVLGISSRTVDNHRANVLKALDVQGMPALLRIAFDASLFDDH